MDNFEDRIEDYYKKIDEKAFEELIYVIENFKNDGSQGPQIEVKDNFFKGIEKIQFSPNINFKCNYCAEKTHYYSIEYISTNKKEIVEELRKIKENYLLGFEKSTPFGVFIDYKNTTKEISIKKSFFNDYSFNRNISSLYNQFGVDITKGTFIDKLDIQIFDKLNIHKKGFIYTFYKDDQSTIQIEQVNDSNNNKLDRIFSINQANYQFSLDKENRSYKDVQI